MFTIFGIGVFVSLVMFFVGWRTERYWLVKSAFLLFFIAGGFTLCSLKVSLNATPDGCERIERYSYLKENGVTETISGPFYRKGDKYYKKTIRDFDCEALWLPFGDLDLVEVDIPGTETDKENANMHYCPSCKLEVNTPYCGQCGTKLSD